MADMSSFLSGGYKMAAEINQKKMTKNEKFNQGMAALEQTYSVYFQPILDALESLAPAEDGRRFHVNISRKSRGTPALHIAVCYQKPPLSYKPKLTTRFNNLMRSCILPRAWSEPRIELFLNPPTSTISDSISVWRRDPAEFNSWWRESILGAQEQLGKFFAAVVPDRVSQLEKALYRKPARVLGDP
jgi:hypothetical protein